MGLFADLQAMTKDELVNDAYNFRVACWANFDDELDPHGHGKRIPYVGWGWRDIDFANKRIVIAHCGFIAVMGEGKEGYPKRYMTETEVDTFIGYLDKVFANRGGTVESTEKIFCELWDWFQTLKIM